MEAGGIGFFDMWSSCSLKAAVALRRKIYTRRAVCSQYWSRSLRVNIFPVSSRGSY